MTRLLIITLCAILCATFPAPVLRGAPIAEVLREARELEQSGQSLRARALLARTASSSPGDVDALLAHAEFLDRYRDSGRAAAYQKVLSAVGDSDSAGLRLKVLRRLIVLSLTAGDVEAARGFLNDHRQAGGAELPGPPQSRDSSEGAGSSPPDRSGDGWVEIPGTLNGFQRMAALSTDQTAVDLLPALARNVFTSGYRASRGLESLVQTEYMKLLLQYLSQARELMQMAGANGTIDVPACESQETAQLLKLLGFRLRNDCGPEAVLETVNPSRAFLSIDSAFPLADLEEAYRRETSFHLPYTTISLPVIFGKSYWLSGARRAGRGDFIEVFLNDPALARLYVAMSKLHRPTANVLREEVSISTLKNYAHVLDFFGGMFEIVEGRAAVPGGERAEPGWEELVGVSASRGAAFFQRLIEVDDGWMASYFDSLWRVQDPALEYLTEPGRLVRFYKAVRGKSTSPGPARPIFRSNAGLLLLTNRLYVRNGRPHIPGGIAPWRKLYDWHDDARVRGKRTKVAEAWREPDDVIEAMFVFCRRVVDNAPLRMFLTLTNIDRARETPLSAATVERMTHAFDEYNVQFSIFNEEPTLSEETIVAYLDLLPRLGKIRNQVRRADTIGTTQALVGLWQILRREGRIPESKADATLRGIIDLFPEIRDNRRLFDAGRAGVLLLLDAIGAGGTESPQDALMAALAGSPDETEAGIHEQAAEKLNNLFMLQRLVSLKDLFDLADHLERVSRGEAFNVAMANRLAARISEVRLPRSELSAAESNAFAHGVWVEKHIQQQRTLNLRRAVDRAGGRPEQLSEIRGELAPILRDTLVGINYIYYSPPGAQLIRANPLFVRSHDFLGSQGGNTWRAAKTLGTGWPSSAGGRLVGSLAGLPYGLADAEQNFMIPSQRQALIWQDLAPQILLGATVPRWWGVSHSEQHFVGLHVRLGEELIALAAADPETRRQVSAILRRKVEPSRLWMMGDHFDNGRILEGIVELTASEYFHLARGFVAQHPEKAEAWGGPLAREIRRLLGEGPEQVSYAGVSRRFGVPHPKLAESHRPELLSVPLFPTLMGYSSRIMAESWEASNLYWASLADETHLRPARLNLLVPEWTQKSLERIFATHLEDWPALWRSMRIVGDDYRRRAKPLLEGRLSASLDR